MKAIKRWWLEYRLKSARDNFYLMQSVIDQAKADQSEYYLECMLLEEELDQL